MDAFTQFLYTLSWVLLPLASAIVLHEYAHGWVANYFGDSTAKSLGRLTLNPIPHIDPIGSILVPLSLIFLFPGGFLFGWAKPVPINPRQLYNPKRDMAFVAAAGPAMNLFLAILSSALLYIILVIDPTLQHNWPPQPGMEPRQDLLGMILVPLTAMALFSVVINTLLFAFNLLPVPPLDGSRVMASLLPLRPAIALSRLEPYGMLIILGLFMVDPYIPIISTILGTVFQVMTSTLLAPVIS